MCWLGGDKPGQQMVHPMARKGQGCIYPVKLFEHLYIEILVKLQLGIFFSVLPKWFFL